MQDTELRLSDLLVLLLRKWRSLVCVGVVLGLIIGAGAVALRLINLSIPEQLERMQAEYEVAYNQYWNAVEDVDRQIRNNENYVEQAKEDLEDLIRKKENYEYDIEDLQADIEYYGLQIVDMEKNIEVLELEKSNTEYRLNFRNEQNENSLFMAIDPYDVKTSEFFIRVDSGYQIIPGSVYQDPDPTQELLQTHRLMVSNAAFYEKLIMDLELDTEVRYLTELVSVVQYNDSSLRVRVIGSDEKMTQQVAEYIRDAILANRDTVSASVSEHTLDVYSSRNYSVVEMEIYDEQQEMLLAATELEGMIREMDAAILNMEAAIRQTRAEVRGFEDRIKDIKTAITNIPVREEELNAQIAVYQDTVNQLRLQRLDLLNEQEPSKPGMTLVGGLVRFVKFAVIGGVVGLILAAAWLLTGAIARGKVLSGKQVSASFGITSFGAWPVEEGKKLPLACVDRWVEKVSGGVAADAELVCANILAEVSADSRILLCGGADAAYIAQVAEGLKSKCAGLDVITAGSYVSDAKAVSGLAACDAVVLVEKTYGSKLENVYQLKERAQAMNKPVLGMVLV